jgi:hypothetical protein
MFGNKLIFQEVFLMRKILLLTMLGALFVSNAFAKDLSGLTLPSFSVLSEKLKVNSFAQMGYQHLSANINLPIEAQLVDPTAGSLEIGTVDFSLQDANFWTGSVGMTLTASEIYSLFLSAGGILPRQFGASSLVPFSANGTDNSAKVNFIGSQVESWYVQTGLGLGPILGGLLWSDFTLNIGDPSLGSTPLANQTLRGYMATTTFCPYIGVAIPAYNALATILYSPLSYCNATLALRNRTNSELQYTWNKPGNFLSASLQYNTTLVDVLSFGLWGNYTWTSLTGDASLEFVNTTIPLSSQKNVTITMTENLIQGGLSLSANF